MLRGQMRQAPGFWLIMLALALATVAPAAAQGSGAVLRLSLSRDFGYSMGADIQGRFTVSVTGSADLAAVTYFVDGQELGRANAAPFRVSFSTGQYTPGKHTLSATARTLDGQTLQSNQVTVNVLSIAEAGQATGRFAIPLVIVILALVALGAGSSFWMAGRNKRGRPAGARSYGLAGGAICPRCSRPFALSVLSLNMVTGKLARCPYCGKWSIVRRAGAADLTAAEAAETADAQSAVPEMSETEKLRRQIEDARYQ